MEFQLTDKVVLVTGASRGIGAAGAKALAACGAKVVVNYLQAAAQARAVVAEIEAAGGRALGPIDVLVNNAHINFPIQPLTTMARGMAMELGPEGITVNVVSPGLTATDATANLPPEMKEFITAATPLRRVGVPEDVAGAVVFLASALADYVTGQYLVVNGGNYMA